MSRRVCTQIRQDAIIHTLHCTYISAMANQVQIKKTCLKCGSASKSYFKMNEVTENYLLIYAAATAI